MTVWGCSTCNCPGHSTENEFFLSPCMRAIHGIHSPAKAAQPHCSIFGPCSHSSENCKVDLSGILPLEKDPMSAEAKHSTGVFSWLWGNEEMADVTVVLATNAAWRAKSACHSGGGSGQRAKRDEVSTDPPEAAAGLPEGMHIPAQRSVLGSFSEYFQKRITGFKNDPCTRTRADGRLTLVVEVEEELKQAAHDVIRLMYQGTVPPDLNAEQLAKMCRIADMWLAPECLQASLTALTQLKSGKLQAEDLLGVLSWLPEGVLAQPKSTALKEQFPAQVVTMFQDVHGLLTNPTQLQRFRKLPFQAVRVWADSDKLVVDSENSVAVALSWWYGGDLGSQATEGQLKELSGLLRVKHLTHAYRLTQLRKLPWFKYRQVDLDLMNLEAATQEYDDNNQVPVHWHLEPRHQLEAEVLKQRTTISLVIPESDLLDAVGVSNPTWRSAPVYAAGTGMQLSVECTIVEEESEVFEVSTSLTPCVYSSQGEAVTDVDQLVRVSHEISYSYYHGYLELGNDTHTFGPGEHGWSATWDSEYLGMTTDCRYGIPIALTVTFQVL